MVTEIFATIQTFLHHKGINTQPIAFEQDTATSEKAALALGVCVGQIAKTIVFLADQNPVLVVASGDVKINSGKLKRYLGVSKVKMAAPETVLQSTGYAVGGVCPVALAQPLNVLLEKSLQRFEVVYTAAGTPQSALPLTMEQLQQATDGCWVELV